MKTLCSISSWLFAIVILIVELRCVLSLHVILGSNCTALCSYRQLLSNTTSDEVACQDKSFESSVGKTFENCVTCEFESKSFDHQTGQTDLGWGLYNLRYTLDWCLFGGGASDDEVSVATCDEACQPTKESLNVNFANSSTPTPYGFCEKLDPLAFKNCAVCYAQLSKHDYLSNFLNLLISACEWKIFPPTDFPATGSMVFTHNPPSNYSTAGANSSTSLSSQAKLAIGITIPVALLLVLLSLLVFWYFKRHLPAKKLPTQSFSPDYQLYERRSEKGTISPESPWRSSPTVCHPTPVLQHDTRHSPHLRLQSPPPGRQQENSFRNENRPQIRVETGNIMAAVSSNRPYSPPIISPPTSKFTYAAMPVELEANTVQQSKRQSKVSSDSRAWTGRREKHGRGKDPAGSEDLFS